MPEKQPWFLFWFPLVLRGIDCLQGERSLFLESHKQCIYWLDEWCDLTFEDVKQLEVETDAALNQVCLHQPVTQILKVNCLTGF